MKSPTRFRMALTAAAHPTDTIGGTLSKSGRSLSSIPVAFMPTFQFLCVKIAEAEDKAYVFFVFKRKAFKNVVNYQ